jgi:hypothetical protein
MRDRALFDLAIDSKLSALECVFRRATLALTHIS